MLPTKQKNAFRFISHEFPPGTPDTRSYLLECWVRIKHQTCQRSRCKGTHDIPPRIQVNILPIQCFTIDIMLYPIEIINIIWCRIECEIFFSPSRIGWWHKMTNTALVTLSCHTNNYAAHEMAERKSSASVRSYPIGRCQVKFASKSFALVVCCWRAFPF